MRWTHPLLLAAAITSALAYPPPYRKSSAYYDADIGPFIPSSPQEVIWHPSPFIPPHDAGPPLRADSYRVPQPRRDSASAARSRRGSYVPPALPPHQPFPRPPAPTHDEFGHPPLPHRHDSLRARPAFYGAPARSRSRSGSVDPAHLPPGFQAYAFSTLHAHGQVQHTPFVPVPAPFQPPVRGHSIPVHPSLLPHRPFDAFAPTHDVNPFLPPTPHHGNQHGSPNPFIPPPPHAAHGSFPQPVHHAGSPPGHPRNDAPWHPKSEAPHPAAGHPLYEKYKNANYGMPAEAHIDAYKRPPHARLDVHVAKAPYEGNPLGLTMPGHWNHPAGFGGT